MSDTTDTANRVLADLGNATVAFAKAKEAGSLARHNETDALNELSRAQKAFDEFVRDTHDALKIAEWAPIQKSYPVES